MVFTVGVTVILYTQSEPIDKRNKVGVKRKEDVKLARGTLDPNASGEKP